MAVDLSTTYMGLKLRSPFVIGASPLADDIEKVQRLEAAGASAIVLHSLFEEQIVLEPTAVIEKIETHAESYPEALSYFPKIDEFRLSSEEYLLHLSRLKEKVNIPVIASLNGRTPGGWTEHAIQMEAAGADAIELNIYDVPTNPDVTSAEIEARLREIVHSVRQQIRIPLAVKLAPFYTSLPNVVAQIESVGANGVVLFNRFYQPDLNIESLEVEPRIYLSTSAELLLRLRWMSLLHGRTKLSLALSGGVHHVQDAIKGIMAGADVLQIVSLVLRQGVRAFETLIAGFQHWMQEHEYHSVEQMRGCLSARNSPNPSEIERANYLRVLQLWRD